MQFRPIDIMKTQEAAQIQQIEIQKLQHAQDQSNKNFQNMIRQEQYKPTQTSKSENDEYRYDAKEKGNNQYSGTGSRKKHNGKDKNKESKDQHKSGGIDIMI